MSAAVNLRPCVGAAVVARNGRTGTLLALARLRRTKGALVAVVRFGTRDSAYMLAGLVAASAACWLVGGLCRKVQVKKLWWEGSKNDGDGETTV